MADNEELTKNIKELTKSVKSIQDDSATHSGLNPQSSSSMQQSDGNDLTGDNLPPGKKPRVEEEDEEPAKDGESEEWENTQALLLVLSNATSAFLEVILLIQE